jgi:hypothetical protein
MSPEWIQTELALIRRDIEGINESLYGNTKGRIGLVTQVEALSATAYQGTWALKTILWLSGICVVALTTLSEFYSAWAAFWRK